MDRNSTDDGLNSQGAPDRYVPAPRPANEEQRQATVDALGMSSTPALPTLNTLCQLVRPRLPDREGKKITQASN